MRLNVSLKTEHSDIVTAVTWSPDSTLLTCSDDKKVCKWAADGELIGKIDTLTAFPASIAFYPQSGKQAPDIFAVSCTDGTFRFVARSGREEKKIQAHEGAVIKVRWSHDGSALLTAGEDGDVKVWSKSGNLRSSLVTMEQSVFAICWGPDDDQVLIASGKQLLIKTVQASRKNMQWDAHDGIVLCVDWNISSGFILSGGEDCVYKVWDSFGRQLYASRPMEHVVTSLAWNPNGDCFAVGSHNVIRLCDKTGWTHTRERLQNSGSILDIAWTSDGTQFAAAGGSGTVVLAQVVGRRQEWKNTEVVIMDPRKVRVQNLSAETVDDLEFAKDRVVELGLGYEYLVVATTTQCHVYSTQSMSTPIIFDIRAPPHFIQMCKRNFMTLDLVNGLQVISFEGKVVSSPKFQGLRPEFLTREVTALSPDTIAVVDSVDSKKIQVLDASSGRAITKLAHSAEVVTVALNQHTLGPQERLLVFLDKNKDLFVASLSAPHGSSQGANTSGITAFPTYKLRSQVDSFVFNDENDVIVGLADGYFITWYYPSAAFVDKDLVPLSTVSVEASDFGRSAQITAFTGSRLSIRKVDGTILFSLVHPNVALLYELVRTSKWEEVVRLCRHERSPFLWASLAAAALAKKQLDTAEIALCEINEVAKVEYIQYIKSIPSEEGRQAELALFRRQPDDALRILLQAAPPLIYRAVKLNLRLFRWTRALELAVKHKSHVDTVLAYRDKYLKEFERTETNQKFLQLASQVTFDWDTVTAKEQQELDDENSRFGGGSSRASRK